MPRFGRILLNATTVLSAILCMTTVVLWARSYRWLDEYGFPPTGDGRIVLRSWCGRCSIGRSLDWRDPRVWTFTPGEPRWALVSHGYNSHDLRSSIQTPVGVRDGDTPAEVEARRVGNLGTTWVSVPTLSISAALAVFPSMRLYRRYRAGRHQEPSGRCTSCGYDLRATPDRCPECGAAPAPSP